MTETLETREAASADWDAPRPWWIAAAALIALGFVHALLYVRVTVDDAFVYSRYAENFAQGHGLVFNPGERADGYTSFLWVTFLAFAAKLGFGTVVTAKALGLGFHVASQVALLFLLREIPFAHRWLALAAPLLVASSAAFAYESVAGLETQMFVFLLLAAVHMALRATRTGRGDLVWAGLLALLTLARPDGVLFFPAFLVWRGLGRNRLLEPQLPIARALLAPTAVFLLLAGGSWAARVAYYGQPLPNPFYAGAPLPPLDLAGLGAYRTLAFFDENGGLLFAGLAALALVGWRSEPWKLFAFLAIAGRLFVQVWSGGPPMGHHRFLVPALPFAVLLFVKALDEIRSGFASRLSFREEHLLLGILVGGILVGSAGTAWKLSLRKVRPEALRSAERQEVAQVRMGKWLRENAAPDARLLCSEVGALPYWSGLRATDCDGLTDRFVARMQREADSGWEERVTHYLFKDRPSYVSISSTRPDRCECGSPVGKALLASREFREGYAPMSILAREGEDARWLFTFRRNDLEHPDPPGKIGGPSGLERPGPGN
ncbi:MAG TPA: hypothetical protein VFI25_07860 [Planctomycetota bacterium]|nr:hypothetical protein [Planctomycetota bacterium]